MSIAFYNGDFLDFSDVKIPLTDRCIFFGDGIYEAAIGNKKSIYLFDEHLKRFYRNAKQMDIPITFTECELQNNIYELIDRNGYESYFLYFQLSRTAPERIHAYPDLKYSNLLITLKKYSVPDPTKTLRLITIEDIRYFMCNVKTLNLIPAVLASKKASDKGCDEAVFLRNGIVTECAHSNIFIIKNEVVYTHPNGNLILPGITRNRILRFCNQIKIPYVEAPFSKEALLSADDVLITSTSKLCLRASEIDDNAVGTNKKEIGNILIDAIYADLNNSKVN